MTEATDKCKIFVCNEGCRPFVSDPLKHCFHNETWQSLLGETPYIGVYYDMGHLLSFSTSPTLYNFVISFKYCDFVPF